VSDSETEGRIAGSNRDPPGNSTRREFVKDGSQTPKWGLANVILCAPDLISRMTYIQYLIELKGTLDPLHNAFLLQQKYNITS
jgi:hypothetical protein